tara:strand:+ start:174 stop:509 length:336 start_codon:yes stop_codon:yes gene_type:complete
MSKQSFNPNIEEDLNRPHNITLNEGQISTILYIMEGYIEGNDDYNEDSVFYQDVNNIFDELQGVVDTYYETRSDNYASKVDSLIDRMQDSRNGVPVGKVSTKHQKTDLDAL